MDFVGNGWGHFPAPIHVLNLASVARLMASVGTGVSDIRRPPVLGPPRVKCTAWIPCTSLAYTSTWTPATSTDVIDAAPQLDEEFLSVSIPLHLGQIQSESLALWEQSSSPSSIQHGCACATRTKAYFSFLTSFMLSPRLRISGARGAGIIGSCNGLSEVAGSLCSAS